MTEPSRLQCRHIFTDGHRCGSPALRTQEFCYYHHSSRRPIQHAELRKRRSRRFTLPTPEDRAAIQSSLGTVLNRLAADDVDPRRAGLLLYGLQIASLNLGKQTLPVPADTVVDEVVEDPTHGPIAPVSPLKTQENLGTLALLLREFDIDPELPAQTPAYQDFAPKQIPKGSA
ncbi:MAG: hypothetical protein PW735_11435 [Acidobacteriaceae bacterium]|nr:hypothetical protein [Acidobacteriaceae bacterium]